MLLGAVVVAAILAAARSQGLRSFPHLYHRSSCRLCACGCMCAMLPQKAVEVGAALGMDVADLD